jgi:uncharacterized membrane protein
MNRRIEVIALALSVSVLASGCSKGVSYAADVQPVLNKNCLECHAAGKEGQLKSGLNMETYAQLMTGTRYGPVVIPGNSISSTLMRLVDHKADKTINMPHDKQKIPENEIALIKAWIDEGAKNN